MKKALRYLVIAAGFALATLPISYLVATSWSGSALVWGLAALNAIGWMLVLTFSVLRESMTRTLDRAFLRMGLNDGEGSIEQRVHYYLSELDRKVQALQTSSAAGSRISSREELADALERIAMQSYRLLDAESAELALFDTELSLYHSALVLGRPFHTSAQAMLSGAVEGAAIPSAPEILIAPLTFAGSTLGSLRVALKKGSVPTATDREILSFLAVQAGLAILNAQYSKELLRMKRSADESVQAKTGFLANLSHELRAPLGIILNASELVIDGLCGPINPEQLETLGLIKTNGTHLLDLVNDVLDYAKVESGKITPNPEALSVDATLKDISGVVRKQAEAKRHRLVCRSSAADLAISCDRRHLRQMLINLLTNAIKYTPEGGNLELWAERTKGDRITISVKDSGIGIAEQDRDKVFSAFERIENDYALSQVGTGLGMPLTKRLCELNGGIIGFDSSPGAGSKFWLSFAAENTAPETEVREAEELGHAKGAGETILLIEHEAGERAMIERYLVHIGFKVRPAGDRGAAETALGGEKVDLVVLDNGAIEQPGDDLVGAVRTLAYPAPLILVSSRAFVFDVEKQLRAGVDRCVSKPVELRELGRICRELIDQTKKGAAGAAGNGDKKEKAPKVKRGGDEVVH